MGAFFVWLGLYRQSRKRRGRATSPACGHFMAWGFPGFPCRTDFTTGGNIRVCRGAVRVRGGNAGNSRGSVPKFSCRHAYISRRSHTRRLVWSRTLCPGMAHAVIALGFLPPPFFHLLFSNFFFFRNRKGEASPQPRAIPSIQSTCEARLRGEF